MDQNPTVVLFNNIPEQLLPDIQEAAKAFARYNALAAVHTRMAMDGLPQEMNARQDARISQEKRDLAYAASEASAEAYRASHLLWQQRTVTINEQFLAEAQKQTAVLERIAGALEMLVRVKSAEAVLKVSG